jgi:hypothetical protein
MHKIGKRVKENRTLKTGNSIGWQGAILEAQRLLVQNKLRASKLRAAIRRFKENLETGEPWPGDSATRN